MDNKIGEFIVARHHESVWNKIGNWTGTRDVGLTPHGLEMSEKMGEALKGVHIDMAVTSELVRSIETLNRILKGMGNPKVSVSKSSAVNERDYGDYTGKYKWDMKDFFGEEKFNCIRREWNCSIPNGETLKMVYERVVPFYISEILSKLADGKNVLLVAHTNSIRALIKYIEKIPDNEINNVEMPFGHILFYDIDEGGCMVGKKVIKVD